MIHSINDFELEWSRELEATQKILKHITDRSLGQKVSPEGRTLGRLAWHPVTMVSETAEKTGLPVTGPQPDASLPGSAKEIFAAFNQAAIGLLEAVKTQWSDETLKQKDNMYGQIWTRAQTLSAMIAHQVHHRGQMTVLMRQAGLAVPGIYGPAREEWAAWGMQPPKI